MSTIPAFTQKEFESRTKKGNWIIDFWAPWCNPCTILAPEVEAAAKRLHGKVEFAKINIDDELELAQQYEMMSITTLLFVKDGTVVHRSVGVIDADEIVQLANDSF